MKKSEIETWRKAIQVALKARETLSPRERNGAFKMQSTIVRHLVEASGLDYTVLFGDAEPLMPRRPRRPLQNIPPEVSS
jgi:hypothetical protein